MDISHRAAQLIFELRELRSLPEELQHILQHGLNSQYLDTLASLATDPTFTEIIYATHESIFVEISSRWLEFKGQKSLSALAAYARILPLALHLADHASQLLTKQEGYLEALFSNSIVSLCDIPHHDLSVLVLSICRLLSFDNRRYAPVVLPSKFFALLQHSQLHIRCLAIRIIVMYLHGSDKMLESLMRQHVGDARIIGSWEDKTIDFTFFSLWEERRIKSLKFSIRRCMRAIPSNMSSKPTPARIISSKDFSNTTCSIGDTLIPKTRPTVSAPSSVIPTLTTLQNLTMLAEGVNKEKPLLITGLPGSGKSRMVREIASLTGHEGSMVTLHLNEQTDAKLLIGMHTSASSPGTFTWRPGVLTTAAIEGRWLLFEDIDRAPTELISTLLPLLERGELSVPTQETPIRAASGFRIIATARTRKSAQGAEVSSVAGMIGLRHWHQIAFQLPPITELAEIVSSLYPLCRPYLPNMMSVYTSLTSMRHERSGRMRPTGPLDLSRWAQRIHGLLQDAGITSETEPIPETMQDEMLLEAVDIFAGDLPSGRLRDRLVSLIARELQIPAKRAEHCLEVRKPLLQSSETQVHVGRAHLQLAKRPLSLNLPDGHRKGRFATTSYVLRLLESVTIITKHAEPCLLVGETGAGKTTIVQQLAQTLGHKLVVVNLSQQSEVGDLLGGYKPINPRTLAMPMKDEFDDLLRLTFPSRQNSKIHRFFDKSYCEKKMVSRFDSLEGSSAHH